MNIIIFGAGGFAREVEPLAWQYLNLNHDGVRFVVDGEPPTGNVINFANYVPEAGDRFVVAIADSEARQEISHRLIALGVQPLYALIAQSAFIGPRVTIGSGSIFCHGAIVTCDAKIGLHFHCNLNSYVAHDCVVGDYVTLAPNVAINGNCKIGDHAYIGTGAVLRQGITVGAGAVIGMGAVVTKDVPAGETWVGNPARRMEK